MNMAAAIARLGRNEPEVALSLFGHLCAMLNVQRQDLCHIAINSKQKIMRCAAVSATFHLWLSRINPTLYFVVRINCCLHAKTDKKNHLVPSTQPDCLQL